MGLEVSLAYSGTRNRSWQAAAVSSLESCFTNARLRRTAFLFYRAEQFILFPLFEHDWHVHQREHRHEQHGEADPVVADMVAEPRERIAVRCVHQKHEIRIEQQVDAINRHRHRQQQQKHLPMYLTLGRISPPENSMMG